jgi:hypothetical protein
MRRGMTTPKTLARTAGVLYLLLAGAAFNVGYVLPRIVKSGNTAATAGNIRASAILLRSASPAAQPRPPAGRRRHPDNARPPRQAAQACEQPLGRDLAAAPQPDTPS